jgi:nitroreductase
MDFYELVRKRRSTRRFKEEPVSAVSLGRILDAGRWAPSGGNLQPWRFVVITDEDVKGKIAEICTKSSGEAWAHFSSAMEGYLEKRGGTPNKQYMRKIPVLIVVCYEVPQRQSRDVALASAWVAIENMLLAATAEGLASCPYTTYDSKEETAIKEALQIPKEYQIAAMLQLGHGSAQPPPPKRKRIEEIVSYEHF